MPTGQHDPPVAFDSTAAAFQTFQGNGLEVGIHHYIAGLYLRRYAAEMSWREDMRATDNSRLTSEVVALAMGRGHSVDWRGYWRRWQHAA